MSISRAASIELERAGGDAPECRLRSGRRHAASHRPSGTLKKEPKVMCQTRLAPRFAERRIQQKPFRTFSVRLRTRAQAQTSKRRVYGRRARRRCVWPFSDAESLCTICADCPFRVHRNDVNARLSISPPGMRRPVPRRPGAKSPPPCRAGARTAGAATAKRPPAFRASSSP